jgi:amidase
VNGLVGIKPTVGLMSRTGIIPIAHSQDTAGPMARTVADAAALLTALAGTDPRDADTDDASIRARDYVKALDAGALKGARLGVVRSQFSIPRNDLVAAEIEKSLAALRAQGAILVDIPELPNAGKYGQSEIEVLLTELKADMAAYLAEWAPDAKVRTLADIIAFNQANADKELAYFGQELFVLADAKGGLESKEYRDALAANRRLSRAEGIDKALADYKVEALVAPTGQPAWLTDFVKGDASGGGFTQAAAVAGYPHITVPAGFVHGLPIGLSFVGTAWSEPRLIALAYAFEQATKARRAPRYLQTVNDW